MKLNLDAAFKNNKRDIVMLVRNFNGKVIFLYMELIEVDFAFQVELKALVWHARGGGSLFLF